jgi:hypothetical protein
MTSSDMEMWNGPLPPDTDFPRPIKFTKVRQESLQRSLFWMKW